MNLLQIFKNIFKSPRAICGGEGAIEILLSGKACGVIKYRRPTSDEKLDYTYQLQSGLGSEMQLKEIKSAENKAKKCHEIMIRDLSIPFAEKIFIGAELFISQDNQKIETMQVNKQFELLKTYWSHALVDMVAIAYSTEGTVKKKY